MNKIFGTQRAEIFKRLSDESESISANIMVALSPFYVSVLRLMLRLIFLRYSVFVYSFINTIFRRFVLTFVLLIHLCRDYLVEMKNFYYEIGSTSDVQVVVDLYQALQQQLDLDLSSEISDIYGDRSNATSSSADPTLTADLNQNVSKAVSRSCYKDVFQELDDMWTASDAIPRY